jgi:hypothetical protein
MMGLSQGGGAMAGTAQAQGGWVMVPPQASAQLGHQMAGQHPASSQLGSQMVGVGFQGGRMMGAQAVD